MLIDAHFEIGFTHLVCQDYAVTGSFEDVSIAIVSDGCSASHDECGQLDVGVRILSHCALKLVREKLKIDNNYFHDIYTGNNCDRAFVDELLTSATTMASNLMLSSISLDATLLIAISRNNSCVVFMYGDGNVTCHLNNGDILSHSIHFSSGAPYYMNYHTDIYRKGRYFSEFSNEIKIDSYICNSNGTVLKTDVDKISINSKNSFTKSFLFNDFKSVSIMSDGILSYQKFNDDGSVVNVELYDVIKELTSFKGNGFFVKKRMNMFNKKVAKPENLRHYDDLSIASVLEEKL